MAKCFLASSIASRSYPLILFNELRMTRTYWTALWDHDKCAFCDYRDKCSYSRKTQSSPGSPFFDNYHDKFDFLWWSWIQCKLSSECHHLSSQLSQVPTFRNQKTSDLWKSGNRMWHLLSHGVLDGLSHLVVRCERRSFCPQCPELLSLQAWCCIDYFDGVQFSQKRVQSTSSLQI